ncbi:MAG: PqqD family peptide modification chaperone [Pyrinomonadaceae bacterium]
MRLGNYPAGRQNDLVVQELTDEVLLYDLKEHKAYCLNHTAAFVWQHADGQTPVSQITYLLQKKLGTSVDESVVWFALEQLEKDGLLEGILQTPPVFRGMSRRQLIRTIGKTGAVALPLVMIITAPSAIHAASCLPQGAACTSTLQCCSSLSCQSGTCQPVGGGCVLWDTEITTADGAAVRARDVVAGRSLLGVNCINGETISGRVKHVMEKTTRGVYSIVAENGAVVNCSPSHDLIQGFGDTKGKRAELFREGDKLLVFHRPSGKIVEATTAAINYVEIDQPVLMFEMDSREHTFISGGIISHNVVKA